jgi:hypothetical protein
MDEIQKVQLAAQVVAVIQAHFRRPTLKEINDVLEMAASQAVAICQPGPS